MVDAMVAVAERQFANQKTDLDSAERLTRLTVVKKKLADAERMEEATICLALEKDRDVLRSKSSSLLAILNVEAKPKAKHAAVAA
jgi:seryl-tRNA(Sec) selenium transferase